MVLPTDTKVRAYKPEDLEQLIGVYKSAFAEPPWNEVWTSEQVIEDLELAFSQEIPIVLVAETQGRLTGFTWGYKIPLEEFPFLKGKVSEQTSYMDEIAVRGGERRRGVGQILGKTYIEKVISQGIEQVILRTDIWNTASMALFRKLGFRNTQVFDPEYGDRIYLIKSVGD